MIRRLGGAAGAALLLALGSAPARATPVNPGTTTQAILDGTAIAFTLRPAYDAGGGTPLSLYVGYADSNVSSPEPAADGQASWYNLNIVEAAAFQPPENCTPAKNAQATLDGVDDIRAWITAYITTVLSSVTAQRQPSSPTVPGPRHACSERFAGFAQSRSPSTQNIPEHSTDNYLDKSSYANACREDPSSAQCNNYKQYWPSFSTAVRGAGRDGSFEAAATDDPSQDSDALLFGLGDGTYVSIGLAHSTTSARYENGALIAEATEVMRDICIMRVAASCTLRIDQMRQYARVVLREGAKPDVSRGTVITGVHGAGAARDVRAEDLHSEQAAIDLSGYFGIKAVSTTHACDPGAADDKTIVADTGGLVIGGFGAASTHDTPNGDVSVPGGGGSMTIGGACVRARLDAVTFTNAVGPDFTPGAPGRTITLPGSTSVLGERFGKPLYGPPEIVTKQVSRVFYRRPIAWRTAPYWASVLASLAALLLAGFAFRRAPAVAPVARYADRFARQFLRG